MFRNYIHYTENVFHVFYYFRAGDTIAREMRCWAMSRSFGEGELEEKLTASAHEAYD